MEFPGPQFIPADHRILVSDSSFCLYALSQRGKNNIRGEYRALFPEASRVERVDVRPEVTVRYMECAGHSGSVAPVSKLRAWCGS